MKILLVHTYGLGDMIMATPAIMNLVECYPEAQIDLLIFQKLSESPVVNAPFVGRIHYCDFTPASIIKTVSKLNGIGYDLALHTSGTSIFKMSLLMLAIRAKKKVGEYGSLRVPWYDLQRRRAEGEHRVLSNIGLVETLCNKRTEIRPLFFLDAASFEFAEDFMRRNGLNGKRVLAIHPGCNEKFANKRWEVEKYIELVKRVLRKIEDSAVLIIVGPQERKEGETIRGAVPEALLVQSDLQSVAALISKIGLMITNDSGLGHIASCFDTPTLTIFSKKSHADVRKIEPYGENSHIVDFRELATDDEVSAVFSEIERIVK